MPEMFQGMNEPVCLIGSDSDGQLYVVKEAKDILNTISQPVVVVSIVGLYRTGKSYLMNRLAGHQSGFALGKTIKSETKGIWMWCVPHPTKSGHTLVLLDTEGLGDVAKGNEEHDTWIFCLAVLLSSTLVYNSLGVIDNMALEKLHFVSKLTKNIQVKAQTKSDCDESTELMKIFPSFIWTVRDFTLKLKLKNGAKITADEYLENALVLKSTLTRGNMQTLHGDSDKVQQYNLPRLFLRNYFAERRCFVFNRPAKDDDLERIEQLTEEELDPRFLQQAKEFCSYVFNNARPKTAFKGGILTGIVLGSLAEVYVATIRSGEVPCLENAAETLAQLQNGKAVKQALQFYKEKIHKSVIFPVEPKVEKEAIETFFTISFNDVGQKAQTELATKINEEYTNMCRMNKEKCRSICDAELKQIFKPLDQGSFMYPGGYQKYKGELQRLTKEYRAKTNKQFMNEEVLTNYLQEKEQIENTILLADQQLTEANRKHEEQRLRTQALEWKQNFLEAQSREREQEFKDRERSYQTNINQLQEQTRQQLERAKEERVLNAKLIEREARLREDYRKNTEEFRNQIEMLRNQKPRIIIQEKESSSCTVS